MSCGKAIVTDFHPPPADPEAWNGRGHTLPLPESRKPKAESPFLALVGAAVLSACGGEPSQLPPGPLGFRVTVTDGDRGRPDARRPFSLEGVTYTLDIEAIPREAFSEGWVAISVRPGDVLSVDFPGAIRANVQLREGVARGVRVTVAKVYGDARVQVEDIGFVPALPGPPADSACRNGIDDDGDGRIDFGSDPGCAYSNDQTETGGSHAIGLSEVLYYANPRIADVQGRRSLSPLRGHSVSPLEGHSINIDVGEMVVTRVSVDGFHVADIGDPGGYNYLFAFNFNTPAGIRVCDKLRTLGGIVVEFFGYTELTYPSWTRDRDWPRPERPGPAECLVPEPVEITRAELQDPVRMESLEAGLVKVTGGQITQRFDDCDYNDNRSIDWEDDREKRCADDCAAALDCSELTQYEQYGQYSIVTAGATEADRAKIQVVSLTVPDFDPRRHAGDTIALVRGTLTHIEFLDLPWIIEVRCGDDLVLSGPAKPMHEACVAPIPPDEDYTR